MGSSENMAEGGTSAWFARTGAELLERGDPAGSMRVCVAGIEAFPWYPTGHVILGRSLEALGRTAEAVLAFRRALAEAPESTMIRHALHEAEKREQQEFAVYTAAQRQERAGGSLTFEEYIGETPAQEKGSAEFLQKQALSARQGNEDRTATAAEEPPALTEEPEKIVTVTLAEIYASQGEYREAIEAYLVLKARRPAEAGRFEERIRELEGLEEKEKPLE